MITTETLQRLKMSQIFRYVSSQGWDFWMLMAYLLLEYVRPQTIYGSEHPLPAMKLVLAGIMFVLLLQNKKVAENAINPKIAFYSIVVLLSCVFALSPQVSLSALPDYLSLIVIYYIMVCILVTEERLYVFVLLFLLFNLKMSQFSFRSWISHGFGFASSGTGGGPGWLQNSGEFGIQMCMFFAMSLYFFFAQRSVCERWKTLLLLLLPTLAVAAVVSCSSRGALLGLLATTICIVYKHIKNMSLLVIIPALVVVTWNVVPSEQKARFQRAGKDRTSFARIERWQKGMKMAQNYPVTGVGFNNWQVADARMFGGEGGLSHNIFIQCCSETGVLGFLALCAMIISGFLSNRDTRKVLRERGRENAFTYHMSHGLDAALIGYLCSGFFVTVLYYPYLWTNLALSAAFNNVARSRG